MPTWPVDLPQFVLRDGYAEGFKDLVVRTKMDTGATKRRRRFSDGPEEHKFTLFLTSDELTIFKTFFDGDLASGSLSFDKIHPRTEVMQTWAFTGQMPPAASIGADLYSISMPLEMLP